MVKTAPVNLSQHDRGRIPAAENAELRLVVHTLFALDASDGIMTVEYGFGHVAVRYRIAFASLYLFLSHVSQSCTSSFPLISNCLLSVRISFRKRY